LPVFSFHIAAIYSLFGGPQNIKIRQDV